MRVLPLLLISLVCQYCFAQKEVKIEQLKEHIGDSIQTRGKVYSISYMERLKNKPTFINVGAAYPNQLLTIVIWGNVRAKLGYKPEQEFAKGFITVVGKVELYKDKPQIIIKAPEQLIILRDEEVPVDEIPPI